MQLLDGIGRLKLNDAICGTRLPPPQLHVWIYASIFFRCCSLLHLSIARRKYGGSSPVQQVSALFDSLFILGRDLGNLMSLLLRAQLLLSAPCLFGAL